VAGGLLLHSFVRVVTADAGFASDALLTFQMNAPDRLTTPEARRAFYEDMFDRLARLPGVTMVGGTTRIPLASTSVTTSVHVEGATPGSPVPEAEFRRAMRDYFQAMNIPLRRGRYFTPGDGMSGVPVVIVNQTLARRLFGDSDPIGRRLQTGPTPSGAWATVIGVVGDIRHTSLESDPLPELYVNYAANPPVSPFIAVRTSGDPAALAEHVRAAMRQMDRTAAVYDLRTMEDVASESVAGRRFVMSLVTACTLLALLLAAVGVYGVVTLVVAQRVPEVGVRLALGATPGSVGRMVIGHALRLSAIGVGIGLLGAAALAPLLRSQLFGVTTSDPLTLLGAPVLLLAVTVLSAWWPARQAMKLDPVVAMRYD
jgi:putative ABC transport system permease protein